MPRSSWAVNAEHVAGDHRARERSSDNWDLQWEPAWSTPSASNQEMSQRYKSMTGWKGVLFRGHAPLSNLDKGLVGMLMMEGKGAGRAVCKPLNNRERERPV